MPYLDKQADVFILNLGEREKADSENRFHPDWVTDIHRLLDEVEACKGPAALVTTATGKFYSNGLDLDWVAANPGHMDSYVARVQQLLARLLIFPMVSIAALPGHAFAAGAMFAMAQDRRIMRADRGFFCFPEVDIDIPFTPGMSALITSRLSAAAAHESMTTGRRYGGEAALAAGLVDQVAGVGDVLATAIEQAQALSGKRGPTLGAIKSVMYAEVTRLLVG